MRFVLFIWIVSAAAFAAENDDAPVVAAEGLLYDESPEAESANSHGSGIVQEALPGKRKTAELFAEFDDGFVVRTANDEFELRIRIMQQTDAKLFLPIDQEPARPGLYIPRFRAYFEGHLTESYEYELSLQRSVEGTFDVLDASVNYRPNEEFQFKFGRFLVPFSYDWYDHLEQYFITPERALFPLNFGLSRAAGAMFWGELNDAQLQYAVGGFSGQQAGLADGNTTRDIVGYLNWRPFKHASNSAFQNLNIGGSGSFGQQAFSESPLPLRTSIQASENDEAAAAASAVFLEFNDDVVLLGGRGTVAGHLSWYLKSFSLESEIQYGRFQYQTPTNKPYVGVSGYHVAMSYFLTGEKVIDRSLVIPEDPFDPANGIYGSGAVEPFARFSRLTLDDVVFSSDLADPDEWTRRVSMVDVGWNWYPNRYVKFSMDWQLAMFDTPVLIDPATDRHIDQNHTLWARAQVFF
jgi:phosphate-selective porin OprO/OprP